MSSLTSFLLKTQARVLRTTVTSIFNNHSNVRFGSSYEGEGKTTINILNKRIDYGLLIDSFNREGFKLNNGVNILGSILLFPKSVLSWKVTDPRDINIDTLSIFELLEPQVDIMIIGVGDASDLKSAAKVVLLGKILNTNIEIYSTQHAISAFNFLNAEGRNVVAALIPPKLITFSDNDLAQTKINRGFVYDD